MLTRCLLERYWTTHHAHKSVLYCKSSGAVGTHAGWGADAGGVQQSLVGQQGRGMARSFGGGSRPQLMAISGDRYINAVEEPASLFAPINPPAFNVGDAGERACDLLVVVVLDTDVDTDEDAGTTTLSSTRFDAMPELRAAVAAAVACSAFPKGQGTSPITRGTPSQRSVAVVGLGTAESLGKAEGVQPATFRPLGKATAALAKQAKAASLGLLLPEECRAHGAACGEGVASGLVGALYERGWMKSKGAKKAALEEVVLNTGEGGEGGLSRGVAVGKGSILAKLLVDAPANVCTPTHLANCAAFLQQQHPQVVRVNVLEEAECRELGMDAYLGVSEASLEPPKFVHAVYTPKSGAVRKKLAVIGKGVTFDTGGYNIKPSGGPVPMALMKFDMGGAAATLGALGIIAELEPEGVEVHFITAACENMVDAKGMRPSDVLTSASGKTIEVGNTDAEGRLTLCDAMWYAQEKLGVEAMVDIATLTGAQLVAVGKAMAAFMAPDGSACLPAIEQAAKLSGDKVWRLPLEASYKELLKSQVADINNIGGPWAGSITAGLFLQDFVKEGVDWAHVDMAGPVWDDKEGPTGYGAALLASWVECMAKEKAAESD